MSAVAERDEAGAVACPRCAAPVGADQDWCLACGDAARTRLVPTPNWRAPVAVLAGIAIAAIIGLVLAFVALTNDSEPAPPANSQAPPPSAATGAPQPTSPTPTAPSGATTAPNTTPPTGATTAPGQTATTPTTTTPTTTTPGRGAGGPANTFPPGD